MPRIIPCYGLRMDQTGNLDLHYTTAAGPFIAGENIFEPLVAKDVDGTIHPHLVEDLPEISQDGLVYTFKLKEGSPSTTAACSPLKTWWPPLSGCWIRRTSACIRACSPG